MLSQSTQGSQIDQAVRSSDESMALLMWVDFKWLMAGQGWWVDTTKFHQDSSYADGFLRLAMASPSLTLRECAVSLEAVLIHLIPVDSFQKDQCSTLSEKLEK